MKYAMMTLVALMSFVPLARAGDSPWWQRPEDWGSQGVILFPPQRGNDSGLMVDSPGQVGADGVVYGPTSNTSFTPQTWSAAVRHDAQGLAYYYDPRGVVPGQVRAPAHDRRVSKPGPTLGQTAPAIRVIDGKEQLWRDGRWLTLAPKPSGPSTPTVKNGQQLGQTASGHYEMRNGRWVLVK